MLGVLTKKNWLPNCQKKKFNNLTWLNVFDCLIWRLKVGNQIIQTTNYFFGDTGQNISIVRSMVEIKPPSIKSLKIFSQGPKIYLGNDQKLLIAWFDNWKFSIAHFNN
jgi:hypothetical protein